MQTYLTNLAELFKLAAMYGDKAMIGRLADMLELSSEPKLALDYWKCHGKYFRTVADTLLLQEIEDYLTDKARD